MQNKTVPTIYFSTYDDIKNHHYGGGGAIAVHEIAKRLSKKYDVHVLSWDYSGKKKETIDGVMYERFGIHSLSPKVGMFVYQMTLPFVMLQKSYDVWMESFCPPFTTALLPLFSKKPVVGIVHMLAAEDMERKYKLPFHLIQNFGLKTYKQIIVTSDVIKKSVEKISPSSSIKIVSNGISKIYKPTIKKENYLLFLGRIEIDQKGIDLLLSAFKQFQTRHTKYKLVIAGSGHEIEKMKNLIKKENLSKKVILKGRVSGKTKETLLKKAAAVVISSRFETYSLVALEAMSYGAPVICFAIEGLSWIPKGVAIKVKPYAVSQLTNAMTNVVTDTKHAQQMIQEGNVYVKQFTWDSVAKQYDRYIASLKV